MKEKMKYDGRMRGERVDVFAGPAVPLAVEDAKSVEPGTMTLTAFSAWDSGHLMGLDGRSLIVKLPESSPENCQPYYGHQWFFKGISQGSIDYGPAYSSRYVERSRCWLIDIAIINNWFADNPDVEAVAFCRLKSLDTGHFMRRANRKLKPPTGYVQDGSHMFLFDVPLDLPVKTGEHIPIGIWYPYIQGAKMPPGILERAQAAPFACVFFLCFQEEHPKQTGSSTQITTD